MISYNIIYLLTLILSIFSLDKKYKLANTVPFFAIFLILFIGFRFESVDFYEYVSIYYRTTFDDFSFPFYDEIGGTTGNEFFYATWSAFLRELELPATFFFLTIAFFSLGIKFYLFKKISPYFYLSVLLYISANFFTDLSQIRNSLAATIVFLAVIPIYKKQLLLFVSLVFLASGIQTFAIIALPLYWIYNFLGNDKKKLLITFLILISISFIPNIVDLIIDNIINISFPQVADKVLGYYNNPERYSVNQFGLGNLFFIILSFYLILNIDRIKSLNPYIHVLITYLVIGVSIYNIFSIFGIIAYRSLELFVLIPVCILLPSILKLFKKEYKFFIYLFIVAFSFFMLTQSLNLANEYQVNII